MKQKTAEFLRAKVHQDYNAIAESFSRTRAVLWPELQFFQPYLTDNIAVLDIGCGNGRVYDLLSEKSIREYVGLDVSEGLIEEAKKRYAAVLGPALRFQTGDMLSLPFADESFDVVFLIAALQHIPTPGLRRQALQEARRVLKKGGLLFMTNWDLWHWRYARLPWSVIAGKIFTPWRKTVITGIRFSDLDFGDATVPWDGQNVFRYYHAFRKKELQTLLREAGFRIEVHTYVKRTEKAEWGFFWNANNILTIAKK